MRILDYIENLIKGINTESGYPELRMKDTEWLIARVKKLEYILSRIYLEEDKDMVKLLAREGSEK